MARIAVCSIDLKKLISGILIGENFVKILMVVVYLASIAMQ